MLSRNEMDGYISYIDKIVHLDPKNYPRAVIEHFFTHVLFYDMPSELGLKHVKDLYTFLQEHSDFKEDFESWSKSIKLTSFQVLIQSFFHKLNLSTQSAQNLCDFIQLALDKSKEIQT